MHVGQEVECDKKMKHPGKYQNEMSRILHDRFQVLWGSSHFVLILDEGEERLIIEVCRAIIYDVLHCFEKDNVKKKDGTKSDFRS